MTYGVTADGFVDKPIETILSEIETAQKAALGAEFDTTSQSPAGQINGVMATKLRELWEVAQAVYRAIDPDAATDNALAALAALTGTVKDAATHSTVTATVNLDAGVTLAAGAVASVDGNAEARFVTTEAVTNSAGIAADVSVEMESEDTGPIVANSGTLTTIETPQTGWNSVTNALDATIGEDIESDEDLRIRRETDLRRAGAAAVDAVKADVANVTDVVNVTVFENDTDTTDAEGVPPHSLEVVVLDGAANDIAQAIWDSIAGGIQAYGSSSGTAVDDDGSNRTVYFSRPSEVDIYIDVEVTVDDDYPATGDTDIKEALVAFGQSLEVGEDVVYSRLYSVIFAISGVVDVTLLETGTAPTPAGTSNIVIGARELGVFDTANITVAST